MFFNLYYNCLPERKDIVIIMLNWTEKTIAKGRMCVGVTKSFDGGKWSPRINWKGLKGGGGNWLGVHRHLLLGPHTRAWREAKKEVD